MVLDSSLVGSENFVYGLKRGGVLLLNYVIGVSIRELSNLVGVDLTQYKVFVVPATDLALKILGRPITNTSLLGALLRVLPVVRLDVVEEVVMERFKGLIAKKNVELLKTSYGCVTHVGE